MAKVLAALSGGVDSAVAAALLMKQGYDVVGVTLRLWSEPGCESENRCCTPETRKFAHDLCRHLGIPFQVLDAVDPFHRQVVGSFLEGYLHGDTPNPCITCNRHIKWGYLLNHAQQVGADFITTGHYARVRTGPDGKYQLWQGIDPTKDQSYMLSMLSQDQLSQTLFPLGDYHKEDVRQLARDWSLPSADLPDSQDLCFLGESDYRDFLRRHAPQAANPGQIIDRKGELLGEHQGLAFYTIGQRKGLPASTRPLYVLEKQVETNHLVVGHAEELGRKDFPVDDLNWISGEEPPLPINAAVKIRFKAPPAQAQLTPGENGHLSVLLESPLRDVTPGQRAVFYQGEQVLGGGRIKNHS